MAKGLVGVFGTALATALGLPAASAPSGTTARALAAERPNIVVVMTDDQAIGQARFTPIVRSQIVRAGANFSTSVVSFSLCCPSRATFLTGQYAHNHGVMDNGAPLGGYKKLDNSNTLAVWLRKSGYETILVGKYLNGYGQRFHREIPPGWTDWHGLVDPSTYRMYRYTINDNGRLKEYGTGAANYQTDVLGRIAADAIRRQATVPGPFFLWFTPVAPHEENHVRRPGPRPAPRDAGRYSGVPLPRPPSFNERSVADKPRYVRSRAPITPSNVNQISKDFHNRAESLAAVDAAVARIFSVLRDTGQASNTIVVYTSDNGYLEGQHRIGRGKVVPYEESIRVPLFMEGPGIPAGVRIRKLVANIDLAPTIAEWAQVRPGRVFDGRSLVPLLQNPTRRWPRTVLLEAGVPGRPIATEAPLRPPAYRGVRTSRYVYVDYATGEKELYDLKRDPYELQNRAQSPLRARIRGLLARRVHALEKCAGVACRR